LALDIGAEQGEPVPPGEYDLDRSARATVATPARPTWDELLAHTPRAAADRPDWDDRAFDELLASLVNQAKRSPRIPWPDAQRLAKLPQSAQGRTERIGWAGAQHGLPANAHRGLVRLYGDISTGS
jgi:hypothetical protein